MTLTIGKAPFGSDPGAFNFTRLGPAHTLYWEDSPRRVRVALGGETVADSRRLKLLHETGLLPVYYFPEDDLKQERFERTDHTSHCPFKGIAAYWTVRVNAREAVNAVWGYPEPLEQAPPLAGYRAFYWSKMDRWFEEEEEVFVHPRDPYHRVDVLDSSRQVRISIAGQLLAESKKPRVLFETGLPPRYYLAAAEVSAELLPSDTVTRCPYKGAASYRSVRVAGEMHEDVVWCYREPIDEAAKIAGRYCFYDERVDVELDGASQVRPRTRWSPK